MVTTSAAIQPHENGTLVLAGNWTSETIVSLQADCRGVLPYAADTGHPICLSTTDIQAIDASGAVLILRLIKQLKAQGKTVHLENVCAHIQALLAEADADLQAMTHAHQAERSGAIYRLGRFMCRKCLKAERFLWFFGQVMVYIYRLIIRQGQMQWVQVSKTIERCGFRALPIVGLLTFLVGVVLAYQISVQLAVYGANIFVVDLTGVVTFREFAPLITAVIVAGRSATAYTAEIGTMKVQEELDALETMGILPIERLATPKVLGLMLVLPLLCVWADITGMLGSMMMAKMSLGVSFHNFLQRFQSVISVSHFWVGLIKMPFFALMIAVVGCFQGFSVSGSAASVGRRTTLSAVQAIFLVILTDAIFSVFFSLGGI